MTHGYETYINPELLSSRKGRKLVGKINETRVFIDKLSYQQYMYNFSKK